MKRKQHLLFISIEGFIDVDIPILKELVNYFSLDWYILLPKTPFGFYDIDFIRTYSEKHDINIKIFQNSNRQRSIKTFYFYCKVFWASRKIKADIIYIESLLYPYLPFALRLFLPKNKIVFAIHDFKLHFGVNNRFIRFLSSRLVYYLFENFHFFSKSQEKYFLECYPHKNTFNTALSLKEFGEPGNKYQFNLDKSKINLLFFGNIRTNKGLDILLNEFNILEEQIRNKLHITVWGYCDNFKNYDRLVLHPENFTLKITLVPNDVIPDLFTQYDFIVLPYRDITQSGVLFIALNYSLPVICSNLDGFKEIEGAGNALLFFDLNITGDLSRVLTEIVIRGREEIEKLKVYMRENIRDKYKASTNAKKMVENIQKIIQRNSII